MSVYLKIYKAKPRQILCRLSLAVAPFSHGGIAMHYVQVLVLWMSSFHKVGCMVHCAYSQVSRASKQILLSDKQWQLHIQCGLRTGGEICYLVLPC